MHEKTYIVRFTFINGTVEVCEWNDYGSAKEHFGIFDESDSDIYIGIVLIERNWVDGNDYLLEAKTL